MRKSRPSNDSKSKHPTAEALCRARHQRTEIRFAIAIADDHFGIDDRSKTRQGDHCIANFPKALSEIATAPTEERDGVAVLMKLEAPAVELHFMNPFTAARRTGLENRRGWGDETQMWGAIVQTKTPAPEGGGRRRG